MRTIRVLSLALLAVFMAGGAPTRASSMNTVSVTNVQYRDHDRDWRRDQRYRESRRYHRDRWEWRRGRDGRWHRVYVQWR
jgi:hypothetical protein